MAVPAQSTETMTEYCPTCENDREHAVSIEMVTESDQETNAAYSREPYRVTECRACGERSRRRMNSV